MEVPDVAADHSTALAVLRAGRVSSDMNEASSGVGTPLAAVAASRRRSGPKVLDHLLPGTDPLDAFSRGHQNMQPI